MMEHQQSNHGLTPLQLWTYVADNPISFMISARFMSETIAEGDNILDIGGGVGRYALYFAHLGTKVCLSDSNSEYIAFSKRKAAELNVDLETICTDTKGTTEVLSDRQFDHIFLRANIYDTSDILTVRPLLKKGGHIYVFFSSRFGKLQSDIAIAPLSISPDDFPSSSADGLFADEARLGSAMSSLGFSTWRIFASNPFIHADENLLAMSEHNMELAMNLAFEICDRHEVIATAPSVVYIGRLA